MLVLATHPRRPLPPTAPRRAEPPTDGPGPRCLPPRVSVLQENDIVVEYVSAEMPDVQELSGIGADFEEFEDAAAADDDGAKLAGKKRLADDAGFAPSGAGGAGAGGGGGGGEYFGGEGGGGSGGGGSGGSGASASAHAVRRVMVVDATFSSLTVWQHERPATDSDLVPTALEYIELARALHGS